MGSGTESFACCVHSGDECRLLLQSVRTGRIRRVKARLMDGEKRKIKPGDVYVYNEDESGIKRWTDKKTWTPSRVQGVFLVYRDLRGPFVKKTHSCGCSEGRFHIVAYTLAEWEDDGGCCVLFKDALAGLAGAPGQASAGHGTCPDYGWDRGFSMFHHHPAGWGAAQGPRREGPSKGVEDFEIYLNNILDPGVRGCADMDCRGACWPGTGGNN